MVKLKLPQIFSYAPSHPTNLLLLSDFCYGVGVSLLLIHALWSCGVVPEKGISGQLLQQNLNHHSKNKLCAILHQLRMSVLCPTAGRCSDSAVYHWLNMNPHACLSGSSSALFQRVDSFPSHFIKRMKSQRMQITSDYGQKLSTILQVSSEELHTRYKPSEHPKAEGAELIPVMCSFCWSWVEQQRAPKQWAWCVSAASCA